MARRDIWKGSISFGLVEIPVALVPAENPQEMKLSQLDKRDFSPIGYRRYNKSTDKEVDWDHIVRGYEYEKGEYVVLTDQDLERANPERTHSIDIVQFVDAAEVEPIYYEKPYYLVPQKPKSKGYVLLRETLRSTGKVGIARVAIRTREHLALLGVRENALALYLLRFAEEVRPPSELENVDVKLSDVGVQPKEVAMAKRLVTDMLGKWNPDEYKDEYVNDVIELVQKKVASGKVHEIDTRAVRPKGTRRGEIIDLMPLLKKSVEAARTGERTRAKPVGPRRRTAARKSTTRARKSA